MQLISETLSNVVGYPERTETDAEFMIEVLLRYSLSISFKQHSYAAVYTSAAMTLYHNRWDRTS